MRTHQPDLYVRSRAVAPDPGDADREEALPAMRRCAMRRSAAERSRRDRGWSRASRRTAKCSLRWLSRSATEPRCWSTVVGLAMIHVGALGGLVWIVVHPSATTLAVAVAFYVASGLGITAGYHRLFAHRTYRASVAVRWFLLLLGAIAFQNSALSWSADHRAHHADTDGDGDPHAVTRGMWHAHMGWLFQRRESSADVTRLTDLWAIRSIRLQHRWYPVVAIGLGLALADGAGVAVGRSDRRAPRRSDSSAPRCCSRRRSASTRSPT